MANEREMAMGRILRMAARPFRPGDIEDYERCRSIIMADRDIMPDHRPNYARDRLRGAQGD